jgi:hypothetical protein
MRLMLPESAFPTGVYREKEWNYFLSIVGMQCEITPENRMALPVKHSSCISDELNDFLEVEI